ncbi:MAG TPA: hypothetical protein VNN73_17605 [Blastocatellia bacterium]|nr:hypothetical protein [Blastocatellia bacterium]
MEAHRTMSKNLAKSATKLERRVENKVVAIRRVVCEYNQAVENPEDYNQAERIRKQQEMERIVGEYIQLCKALRRLRNKLQRR